MIKASAGLIAAQIAAGVGCTTAFALDLQPHTGYDRPKSDFQRSLEHPISPSPAQPFPTEVRRGNYYAGPGTGGNLTDQHGQPDRGYGAHFGKRY